MKVLLSVLTAVAGTGLCLLGVRLVGRPRPLNLAGMLLAPAGLALALSAIAAAFWWAGR